MNQDNVPIANHHTQPQSNIDNKINNNMTYVAFFTLFSRVLGFIRIGVISALYGATGAADLLNLVLSIPNNLRKLLAEGALHNAYMPAFANTVSYNSTANKESRHLLSEIILYFGIFTGILVTVMSFFSEQLTSFLFDIPLLEDQLIVAKLFSYIIYFLLLMTLASILMGLLQTHKQFIAPAVSPIVMSVTTISFILIAHKYFGTFAVVYGYLLGGLLQIILLASAIRRLKYKAHHICNVRVMFRKPSLEFINILKRFPLVALAVIFPILGQQISFYLASTLTSGSTSAFSYAIVFWQLPTGVVTNSIISVSFTYLLTHIHAKETRNITLCIENGIDKMRIMLVPLSILFFFFSYPGIAITLQRGRMDHEAVLLTSHVLSGYALSLFPMGLFALFQKTFLAFQKNSVMFFYSFLFTIIDVLISMLLIKTSLGVSGLSWAYTITLVLIVPIMFFHIKRYAFIQFQIKRYLIVCVSNIPLIISSYLLSIFTYSYWESGSNIINIIRFFVLSLILLTIIIIGNKMVGINFIASLKNIRGK